MSVNVKEVIRKLNPAERKKIEDRSAEIIAEEMSLRDLRKPITRRDGEQRRKAALLDLIRLC